jgi:ankyrin repeat protein
LTDHEDGRTALHLAVEYGSMESIVALIKYGAEVDVIDNDGQTPLMLAQEYADNT